MPSLEYTQAKGLVQKSSTTDDISLQGQVFGQRDKVTEIANGAADRKLLLTHALEDSGKQFVIAGQTVDSKHILLPRTVARKTSALLALGGALTVGKTLTIDAFGARIKFLVVADNGEANGTVVDSTGAAAAGGGFIAVRVGATPNAAEGIDNLAVAIPHANAFTNTVSVAQPTASTLSIEAAAAGSKNGTITTDDANLSVTFQPNDGGDAVSSTAGFSVRYRLKAAPAQTVAVRVGENNIGTTDAAVLIKGLIMSGGGTGNFDDGGDTKVTFAADASIGDFLELVYDGSGVFYATGLQKANGKIVFS